jgi:hypothetical protein
MFANLKVHQTIDIIVVDIPNNYDMLLSQDCLAMLNSYFSINWSHLCLPFNGKMNQSGIDGERYMKHVVTDLNDLNELVMFNHSILGNYSFETFFGNFTYEPPTLMESNTTSEILHFTQIIESSCDIDVETNNPPYVQTNVVFRDKLEKHTHYANLLKTKKYENSKIPVEIKKR